MTSAAVMLACDAGHAPYALCLADQIARAHPKRDFDICIFSDEEISVPVSLRSLDVRLLTWQRSNPFRLAPNPSRHGTATWLRLLVPEAVRGVYERVLYLDSDIILRGAGIEAILAADLKGHVLGAVRDQQQWRRPLRQVAEFRIENLPPSPYFNAGVLLVDVDEFNAQNILDESISLMRRRPEALIRHDQSVLNLLLRQRWAELSPVWNWQFTAVSRFHMLAAEPRLIHFIGPRKPWNDMAGNMPASFRQIYKQFQENHYPTTPDLCPSNPGTMCWPERPIWSFLKHSLNAGRTYAYLSRFRDSCDVLAP